MSRTLSALVAIAVLVGGCGEHRSDPPTPSSTDPAAPTARIVVTTDFGRDVMRAVDVEAGRSVLDTLRGVAAVETAYGGGFVQSIDGKAGDLAAGVDWLFFVNGRESPVGAAAATVARDDEVWWDYRRWQPYVRVPVVVGAWPRPFAGHPVTADPPLDAPLSAAGATAVADAANRVVVGVDSEVRRREPSWAAAVDAPAEWGLTVWIADGRVRVYDVAAGRPINVAGATAVAAAIEDERGVVFVVSGLDAAAAQVAAEAIAARPDVLHTRYAVAFAGDRVVAAGGIGATS